jgi:hypothetical protein
MIFRYNLKSFRSARENYFFQKRDANNNTCFSIILTGQKRWDWSIAHILGVGDASRRLN